MQFGSSGFPNAQQQKTRWLALGAVLLIIVAVCVLGYMILGVVVTRVAKKIPDQFERDFLAKFGDVLLGSESAKPVEGSDAAAFKQAEAVFSKLIASPGLRDLTFKLHYMNSKEPNAFAAPGGAVAVTQGVLNMVPSRMGIAMVLAHEIGHHEHRDPLTGMGRGLLLSLVSTLLFGSNGVFGNSMLGLAEASHSRSQEFAADAFGLRLVHSTFGTTKGALEFFEAIERTPNMAQLKGLTFLSTHPYTPDRIMALRRQQKQLQILP